MERYRFSVASLMGIILLLAFGMAALRNPSELWASATFTVAVILFSTSVLGAVACRAQARLTWVGMAVFGWVYLVFAFAPSRVYPLDPPPFMLSYILENAQDYLVSDGKKPYGFTLLKLSNVLVEYRARGATAPLAVTMKSVDVIAYRQTGHSLGAVLFGIMGSFVGRIFAGRGERSENR